MVEPSDLPPEFLAYGIQVYVSLSGLSNLDALIASQTDLLSTAQTGYIFVV